MDEATRQRGRPKLRWLKKIKADRKGVFVQEGDKQNSVGVDVR